MQPDRLSARINKLPKRARDYIHNIHTFVGAPEVHQDSQRKILSKILSIDKACELAYTN
jgi:hypothetical protein